MNINKKNINKKNINKNIITSLMVGILTSASILWPISLSAETEKHPDKKTIQITDEKYPQNADMVQLGESMQKLYPLIFSDAQFHNPKNQLIIKQNIDILVRTFEKTKKHFNQHSPSFAISYDVLLDHLKETQTVFNKPDLNKANHMLRAIPSMCASCHTQDNKSQSHFMGMDRTHFASDFDFAEFSFTTRDYGNAIFFYDRFLTKGGVYRSEKNSEIALQRLMTLYTQINKDLTLAATYLKEYVPFISEYPQLKHKLNIWITSIIEANEKLNTGYNNLDYMNFGQIKQFVEAYLWDAPNHQHTEKTKTPGAIETVDQDKVAYYIILRGIVYRYLDNNPKKEEIPALLYWLAKCDKALNFDFYVSYADVYLKECYTKYPHSPYADLCKKEHTSLI